MNKFKLIIGTSPGTAREFASGKALAQFKRRNPALEATAYIYHNNAWERYVTYGSKYIPESVLRSLLNSLHSSNSLNPEPEPELAREMHPAHHAAQNSEAPAASPYEHISNNLFSTINP